MKTLTIDQFDDYFLELHGYLPFAWQKILAERIERGDWPRYLKAPTASGKTSLVDIVIFNMAVEAALPPVKRQIPRRVFFVVDRRIIVDETYRRGMEIAHKLRDANTETPVLEAVRERLMHLGGTDELALDCVQLRGGIYRDDHWVRSLTQPTVIASTVDQVGSRLLFRGYGVSESARPIHAALVGNDSLIILDEAHISQPFSDTLRAVERYRQDDWVEESVRTPFRFIEMTATPPNDSSEAVFNIDDPEVIALSIREPLRDERLSRRRRASKQTQLIPTDRSKGKSSDDALVEKVVEQTKLAAAGEPKAIAVIVNRVATARHVHRLLNAVEGLGGRVELMIGRMRPIDRDALSEQLREDLKTNDQRQPLIASTVVVATQCLEVGADFDFDAIVTECASIDALRQRFGRLNRAGRDIVARGIVVMRANEVLTPDQLAKLEAEGQEQDPIYGNAMARTWNWLNEVSTEGIVDFGIDLMTSRWEQFASIDEATSSSLKVHSEHAPALFPAYLDRIAQTSPTPEPDLDVALFLHGPQRNDPEVQICWRADLPESCDDWIQIISLLPPSSSECLSVPIRVLRRWLASDDEGADLDGDAPMRIEDETTARRDEAMRLSILIWRGAKRSLIASSLLQIRPGDTLVLSASAGGWSILGYIPNVSADSEVAGVDRAERAFATAHDKAVLRIHPAFASEWPTCDATNALFGFAKDPELDLTVGEIRELLKQVAGLTAISSRLTQGVIAELANSKTRIRLERYPDGKAILIKSLKRIGRQPLVIESDDGEDVLSLSDQQLPTSLTDHTQHVCDELNVLLERLAMPQWRSELLAAAEMHDWGKADERFQAMLLGCSPTEVAWQPEIWAKSGRLPQSRREAQVARQRSGLPDGFRHELLSVSLAECSEQLPDDDLARDLILHLIASHHGYARPFAPPIVDDSPPTVVLVAAAGRIMLSDEARLVRPTNSLCNDHANRYWRVLRRFGWWGTAYLESMLRISDQRASAKESSGVASSLAVASSVLGQAHPSRSEGKRYEIVLGGLDGGNSLAFLASLGILRTLSLLKPTHNVALSWSCEAGVFRPRLFSSHPLSEDSLIVELYENLRQTGGHEAFALGNNLNVDPATFGNYAACSLAVAHKAKDKALGRVWADFAAGFGCEAAINSQNKEVTIQDTALRTMSGAGHQHFLKFMRDLIGATEPQHLQQAMFEEWRYEDEGRGLNLRWDPEDDRRYALRWTDPSSDPSRTVRGANRLGIEAIPMLLSVPCGSRLETTGFKNRGRDGVFWTWPIWSAPLSVDAVVALLSLCELQQFDEQTKARSGPKLREFGIVASYRCERIRIGKFRNFTAAEQQ